MSETPILSEKNNKPSTFGDVLKKVSKDAMRGGIAGASSQIITVCSLMWLRTTMNYQYRYGGGTMNALKTLYKEGGVVRFYRGLAPALIQAPLSRFGDTAANVGVLSLLDAYDSTKNMNVATKTALASTCAAGFRIFLMPIDAWKTIKQVEGHGGLQALIKKVQQNGIRSLWHGSGAAVAATWVGHYPWFATYNYLQVKVKHFDDVKYGKYIRNAVIGFTSSVVSDTCSNSIRVLKTTRQTSKTPITYLASAQTIIANDGISGLFFRGLGTRLLTNGLQGMVFSVGWKVIQDYLEKKQK